jgi:hypothetical protein
MAGYEDVNDAERVSQDPPFRLIGSEKVLESGAALTSRLKSFETELLTQQEKPSRPWHGSAPILLLPWRSSIRATGCCWTWIAPESRSRALCHASILANASPPNQRQLRCERPQSPNSSTSYSPSPRLRSPATLRISLAWASLRSMLMV